MQEENVNGITSPTEDAQAAEEAVVDKKLESETSSEPASEEKKSDKPKNVSFDTFNRRLERATSRIQEAEARARANEERAAHAETQLATLTGTAQTQSKAQPASVEDRATEIAETRLFNDKCNNIYNATVKEYPDFKDNYASLTSMTGALEPKTLEVLIDADAPSKVLKYLADNPDEAVDILSLPPTRLAREIAKLEIKLDQDKPKASSAPKPISPVKASGSSSGTPDPSDVAAWIADRNKKELDRKRGR